MPSQQDQHILIIGAGISGLAIAQGLKKAKIAYSIFDAETGPTTRRRDWTMTVHWGLPLLESLLPENLVDRIRVSTVVDPSLDYRKYPNNIIFIYNGLSGKLVKEVEYEGIRVSRGRLRALCNEGIDVKWDHVLDNIRTNADGTVSACFKNGASYSGTLLIGTDGAHSRVRRELFGAASEMRLIDVHLVIAASRQSDVEQAKLIRSAGRVSAMAASPDCFAMINMQDTGEDPTDAQQWLLQCMVAWKADSARKISDDEARQKVRELAQNLAEPFKTAVLTMPIDARIDHSFLGSWAPPTDSWDTRDGRVTLAGDAAYSMPPFRGQGLNNALNDAYNLVSAIKTVQPGSQASIIQKYSQETAERGSKEVPLALKSAEMMMDFDRFEDSPIMKQGLKRLT